MACMCLWSAVKGWVGVLLKKMLFNTDVEFSGLSTASNLNERAFVPSTGDIKSYGDIWTGMYDGVNRTNDVIEGIEQSLCLPLPTKLNRRV